jgi:hypothetical protein
MKHLVASLTIGACLLLPSSGVVFAENPHGAAAGLGVTTGRPGTQPGGSLAGASCGDLSGGAPPGQVNSSSSTNSPFALDAMGQSKAYAGIAGNSGAANGQPASQYDVACFQHASPPPP